MSPRDFATEKSTNVRLAAARAVFGGLSRAAPGLAAQLAMAAFRRPPRHRASPADRSTLDSARRVDVVLDGGRLAVWKWGEGPAALLVHGWGSRGSRLAAFVTPLTSAGHSVLSFDAPGHGASSGRLSSLPQFMAAVRAIADARGPLDLIVAHSMGGAAVTLAMARGVAARRVAFLAPAADPAGYSERFASVLGLTPEVLSRMKRGLERRFGLAWEDFDVLAAARKLEARLLVVHDRDDRDVLWEDGAAIAAAWRGAELVSTTGLGHRRIVQDPTVVARAVEFLTAGAGATSAAGLA